MNEVIHPPAIREAIIALRATRRQLLDAAKEMIVADNAALYELDLIATLAIKRAVSTTAGFTSLIEQSNMVCARTLLRTQIDSVLRFYAFSLVDEPHEMARQVIAGTPISKMKDRQGVKMRDAYLVQELNKEISWLATVYGRTSGYVHLSKELLGLTVRDFGDTSGQFTARIGEIDDLPEQVWLESIACFQEATELVIYFIITWTHAKRTVAKSRSA